MFDRKEKVLANEPVGGDCHRLTVACHEGYVVAAPGQFVMLKPEDGNSTLLRRPFSIHRLVPGAKGCQLTLLYKVVGATTAQMATLKAGDRISLLGPLGRGFEVSGRYRRVYMACGGIGTAPMVFLLEKIRQRFAKSCQVDVFLGGRSRQDLLCRDIFESLEANVTITTDDGSAGDQCLLTDPLEVAVGENMPDMIYACGPEGMLACVAGIARRNQAACQLSIETVMACGMGACLGCATPARGDDSRYLHACVDGPVFDVDQLDL